MCSSQDSSLSQKSFSHQWSPSYHQSKNHNFICIHTQYHQLHSVSISLYGSFTHLRRELAYYCRTVSKPILVYTIHILLFLKHHFTSYLEHLPNRKALFRKIHISQSYGFLYVKEYLTNTHHFLSFQIVTSF
jgi:hypothetical protein